MNPITLVGHIPGQQPNPIVEALRAQGKSPHETGQVLPGVRSLSLGRLWLGTNTIQDTTHKHGGGDKTWDRTMQFVIWEKPDQPLAFMIANEAELIRGYRKRANKIEVHGTDTRSALAEARTCTFLFRPKEVEVIIANEDGPLSSVAIEREHFVGGLEHLFPNGEMIDAESN